MILLVLLDELIMYK